MRVKPNFLELRGYRLPTDAEWERVCRGETQTARYFGETDRLLGSYAWYDKNLGGRSMRPVGALTPNDSGVFDLYGNALEWCMDDFIGVYDESAESRYHDTLEDFHASDDMYDYMYLVLRGGHDFKAANMRSAARWCNPPNNSFNYNGFRVSRTYPLPP
jgi:formylglycine-generating enzyme required for sulfatase activity